MRRRSVAALAISHLAADLNQGALPAMLPLFIVQRHFSYEVAAYLVMAVSGTSSLLQPAVGWIVDRRPSPWLAPAGVLLSGVAMAFAGIAPTDAWLIAAAAVSGLGLAAYHPEGARLTHYVSGEQRGMGMSLFSVGGNLGFAVGPILMIGLLGWFGLSGSVLLAVPAVVIAAILALELRTIPPAWNIRQREKAKGEGAGNEWRPFSLLMLAVVTRSIVFFGLNTFLPLYWMHVFGTSRATGSSALSVFLFSGATGTLIGGKLGDRFSRVRVVTIAMALVLPFLLALLVIGNAGLATVVLVPMAIALFAPFSVMVVLGQEYLPERLGVASGLTIGLAGTVGGLGAPFFGMIGDRFGLPAAFFALFLLACVSPLLTWYLPTPKSARTHFRAEQIEVEI
jgi:FSR family fosmidomycin resistance protein-like MFS transporter